MENIHQKTLRIEPAGRGAWIPAAANFLGAAMEADPLAGVEQLRRICTSGDAQLYIIKSGDYMVGAFVLRIEQKPGGAEGVIVAAGGNLSGVNLMRATLGSIEQLFKGCVSIRAHISRRGLMRQFARAGYAPREIVASKAVS